MLNPFGFIARAFYAPFKAAIIAAWDAAKTDAIAEIKVGLPTDADVADVNTVLMEIRQQPAAIEDEEPAKRRFKK